MPTVNYQIQALQQYYASQGWQQVNPAAMAATRVQMPNHSRQPAIFTQGPNFSDYTRDLETTQDKGKRRRLWQKMFRDNRSDKNTEALSWLAGFAERMLEHDGYFYICKASYLIFNRDYENAEKTLDYAASKGKLEDDESQKTATQEYAFLYSVSEQYDPAIEKYKQLFDVGSTVPAKTYQYIATAKSKCSNPAQHDGWFSSLISRH